jgi:hypothetical protein
LTSFRELFQIAPTMMDLVNATPTQLRKAADIQEQILELQDELNQLLGAPAQVPALAAETATTEAPKRRKVSAAGKARMRAAQLARWAKIKGTAPEAEPEEQPKRKQLSEAKLKGLAKARAARLAKLRAAKSAQAEPADKAVQEKPKKKRKMTEAWRRALDRAHAARRAKGKAAGKAKL